MEGKNNESLSASTQEFEALFLGNLLKEMRKTVMKNDFFGNSMAMEFFQGFMDDAIAKEVAQSGGVGVGSMLENQLKKYVDQEASPEETQNYRQAFQKAIF